VSFAEPGSDGRQALQLHVWPTGTDFTDPANARHPSEDVGAVARYIGDQVTAVVAPLETMRRLG
jgi:hypothetical protein